MVKNGYAQSSHGALELTVPQKLNRWNILIFYMLVQIQESLKLIQSLFGGPGRK